MINNRREEEAISKKRDDFFYRLSVKSNTLQRKRIMNIQRLKISIILIVSIFSANFSMAQNDRQPNIILINVDDISAKEFATYGGNMKLPAVEQLAKEGVQFKTAWASPECGPSRAMLLTGTYPHNNGNYQNQIRPDTSFLENPKHTLLFPTMKAAGYSCGMFGKMHHERNRDPKIYQVDDYCLWKMWKGRDLRPRFNICD